MRKKCFYGHKKIFCNRKILTYCKDCVVNLQKSFNCYHWPRSQKKGAKTHLLTFQHPTKDVFEEEENNWTWTSHYRLL